jgi:hypothetical protein
VRQVFQRTGVAGLMFFLPHNTQRCVATSARLFPCFISQATCRSVIAFGTACLHPDIWRILLCRVPTLCNFNFGEISHPAFISQNSIDSYEISDSHGGEYEDDSFLGYSAV